MSPVDLESLGDADRAAMVPKGWTCPKCAYPLEGLRQGGTCPECGTPIRQRAKRISDARDNLTDAPINYLLRLHLAFAALAALGVVNSLLQIAFFVGFARVPVAYLIALAGAAWAAAVLAATRSRPFVEGSRRDPEREMSRLRLAARLTQWAWVVQGLAFAASESSAGTPASDVYMWIARAAQLVGVLGFAPLCVWFANIAEWAQYTELGWRLRLAAGLLGACGLFWTVAGTAGPHLPPGLIGGLTGLLAIFAFMGYVVGLGFFLWSQLQLARMSQWAIRNARSAEGRDERVMERRARRMYSGVAAEGTMLAELTGRRGDESLDPCPGCGYDRSGLPVGARCPECGREAEGGDVGLFIRPHVPRPPDDDEPLPLVGGDDPA